MPLKKIKLDPRLRKEWSLSTWLLVRFGEPFAKTLYSEVRGVCSLQRAFWLDGPASIPADMLHIARGLVTGLWPRQWLVDVRVVSIEGGTVLVLFLQGELKFLDRK